MGSALSKKEKQLVIVSVAAASVALLAFALKSQPENPKSAKNLAQDLQKEPQVIEDDPEDSNYDQLFQETLKSIVVTLQQQYLTLPTIQQILEKSTILCKKEYQQITLKNRQERRKVKNSSQQKYQELVLQYNEDIENLLERKQNELCVGLKIEEQLFQDSAMRIMELGNFQPFFVIQASIRQKIKESIASTKTMTKQDLQQVVEYQLSILQKKPKTLTDIIQNLSQNQETQQLIPLAVNTILADYVWEKFQIEEEDMIKMMTNPANFSEQKMQQLMMQLEQSMYELMGGGYEGGL